jgi:hypothetical protein
MKLTLHIKFNDGTSKDVPVSAADMVAFEDKFDTSIARLEEARISWLLFLAWHSEKRRKTSDKDFETWLDTVDTIGESEDPKAGK